MKTSIILGRASRLVARKAAKIPVGLYTQAAKFFIDHRHFCSCCQRAVPFWLDYDSSYRQVVCPFCESHPRHRLLAIYFEKFFRHRLRSEKILHVAPENAISRKLRALNATLVVTLDQNRSGVDIQASLENLPFADQTFDAVICSHVLEHVQDDQKAMREIARVLQPDGWAYVGVPLDGYREHTYEDSAKATPAERLTAFGREDHLRVYGRDYSDRLRRNGLKMESVSPESFLTREEMVRLGLECEDILMAAPAASSDSSLAPAPESNNLQ